MSLKLTRFSQEVDVESDALAVSYFAIFQKDDGQELRLPISQEASQAIIAFVADKTEKRAEVSEEEKQDATVFGAEEPQPEEEELYEDEEYTPDSEEAVPSL